MSRHVLCRENQNEQYLCNVNIAVQAKLQTSPDMFVLPLLHYFGRIGLFSNELEV